jgi:hypothetical protein
MKYGFAAAGSVMTVFSLLGIIDYLVTRPSFTILAFPIIGVLISFGLFLLVGGHFSQIGSMMFVSIVQR